MFKTFTTLATLAIGSLPFMTATPAKAQGYPIDCAILLCLSGGWPASSPCAQARAEFIRRVTPWPIEPPLQIWRCPMRASSTSNDEPSQTERFWSIASMPPRAGTGEVFETPIDRTIRAQSRADIDISGHEFDFVRSIKVYDVRDVRQGSIAGTEGCDRTDMIFVGSYGLQGDFSWRRTSPARLPDAHVGLEDWQITCSPISHRSVFVEWRDYEGNYGFEQVNY